MKDTKMINTDEYIERFYDHCRSEGLTQLSTPETTEEFVYCALEPTDFNNFDNDFWSPAISQMVIAIRETENGQYYRLDVVADANSGVICLVSSRGVATWEKNFRGKVSTC
jgi:hypothetical protein